MYYQKSKEFTGDLILIRTYTTGNTRDLTFGLYHLALVENSKSCTRNGPTLLTIYLSFSFSFSLSSLWLQMQRKEVLSSAQTAQQSGGSFFLSEFLIRSRYNSTNVGKKLKRFSWACHVEPGQGGKLWLCLLDLPLIHDKCLSRTRSWETILRRQSNPSARIEAFANQS